MCFVSLVFVYKYFGHSSHLVYHTTKKKEELQKYLQLLKQRDIQEIEIQVIKGQKTIDDYIEKHEEEYQKLVDEKERLVRSINTHKEK